MLLFSVNPAHACCTEVLASHIYYKEAVLRVEIGAGIVRLKAKGRVLSTCLLATTSSHCNTNGLFII
jgi:hypothetical protein